MRKFLGMALISATFSFMFVGNAFASGGANGPSGGASRPVSGKKTASSGPKAAATKGRTVRAVPRPETNDPLGLRLKQMEGLIKSKLPAPDGKESDMIGELVSSGRLKEELISFFNTDPKKLRDFWEKFCMRIVAYKTKLNMIGIIETYIRVNEKGGALYGRNGLYDGRLEEEKGKAAKLRDKMIKSIKDVGGPELTAEEFDERISNIFRSKR